MTQMLNVSIEVEKDKKYQLKSRKRRELILYL